MRQHQNQLTDAQKSQNPAPSRNPRRQALQAIQRAQAAPETLTPSDVRTLQRSVGNQATARLLSPVLQAKLTLGAANDRYEQEADQVADQVVRRMGQDPVSAQVSGMDVQRQEDEEELQMKAMPPRISALQRSFAPGKEVQRQEEEEELQMKPLHGAEGGEVEQSVQTRIQAARGSGQALDGQIRRRMEQGFGHSLDNVRIHTNSQADTLNRSLNARAFTVGNDIFFRQGEYNPGSQGGQKLLAHELTHTIQQSGGSQAPVQRKTETIQRNATGAGPAEILTSRYRQYLYNFAKQELSTENIDCWEAIQSYKAKSRRSVAVNIYDTYISNDSPRQANISGTNANAVKPTIDNYRQQKQNQSFLNKLARKLTAGQLGDPNLFDAVEKDIMTNISDTFSRFRLTAQGQRVIEALNKDIEQSENLKNLLKENNMY